MAERSGETVSISYDAEHSITLHMQVASVKEAKAAIKRLRLEKKQINAEKRQVNVKLREIRAEARARRARRGPAIRGRGAFFGALRTMDQFSRSADRRNLEDLVAPYEAHRNQLDRNILAIDDGIHQLESWIVQREIAEHDDAQELGACRRCGAALDSADVFCGACGAKVS